MEISMLIYIWFIGYFVINSILISVLAKYEGNSDLWMMLLIVTFWPVGIFYVISKPIVNKYRRLKKKKRI